MPPTNALALTAALNLAQDYEALVKRSTGELAAKAARRAEAWRREAAKLSLEVGS